MLSIRLIATLFLCSFWLRGLGITAEQPVFFLDIKQQNDPFIHIQEPLYIYCFKDTSKSVTFDAVYHNDQLFHPVKQKSENILTSKATVWYKLKITSNYNTTQYFVAGGTSKINLFLVTPDGKTVKKSNGFTTPAPQRDVRVNSNVFKLPIHKNETLLLYIQYIQDIEIPSLAATYLIKEDFFWHELIIKDTSVFSLMMGALLVMLVFNLLLLFITRERTYVFYTVYIMIVMLVFLIPHISIHNNLYYFSDHPEVMVLVVNFLINTVGVFYCLFMRSFVDLKRILPDWNKVIVWFMVVRVLTAPVLVYLTFFVTSIPLSQLAFIVDITVLLVSCYKIYNTTNVMAKYLISGTLFFALCALLSEILSIRAYYVIGIENLPPIYEWPNHLIKIGITGELALFSLGLGMKSKLLTLEKEQAQQDLINQLIRNEQIQKDAQDLLERKVDERTAELLHSNNELLLSSKRNELIFDISKVFLNKTLKESISYAMEKICTFSDADRSYLFFFTDDKKQMTCFSTYNVKDVPKQLDVFDTPVALEIVPKTIQALLSGNMFIVDNVDEMEPCLDKEIFKQDQTKSCICAPLIHQNEVYGFIGFDSVRAYKKWTHLETYLLQMTAEIVSSRFARYRVEKEVSKKNEQIVKQKEALEVSYKKLQDAQLQLVQSEKMASLGLLTAGVAHEINNPINFVSSNIEPLRQDLDEILEIIHTYQSYIHAQPQLPQEVLSINEKYDLELLKHEIIALTNGIEEGAMRTKEIVAGLRNFSRIDDQELKEVDIHECIETTLMLLSNKFKGRIDIIKQYESHLPKIAAYPGKLNQVFMNIISNAIYAIKQKGSIHIYTGLSGDTLKIRIKDSGEGMSADTLSKIFDPFFTTKSIGEGTGLGLSISYGIIEKHRGKIAVTSEIDKGTEFTITLPIN